LRAAFLFIGAARRMSDVQHAARNTFPYNKAGVDIPITVDTYADILDESAIDLNERLAFACRFLPDAELQRFSR
jgi:hypothetical protein